MKFINSVFKANLYKRRLRLGAFSIVPLLGVFLWGCDIGDFGDMNVNPTQVSSVSPGMQFTNVLLYSTGRQSNIDRTAYRHAGPVVQMLAHPSSSSAEYSHNVFHQPRSEYFFADAYTDRIKLVEDILYTLREMKEEGEEVDNMIAAARIMRVYVYHQVTDLYGDMPYFEAGKGYRELIFEPRYDRQEDIYDDFLKELDEAVSQMDDNQPTFGEHDLIYGGNVDQWRKFGNSLRLRLALRLVKVDPEKAQQHAVAAINAPGGLMERTEDTAYIKKLPQEGSASSDIIASADYYIGINPMNLGQALVQYLDERDDPRLNIYGAVIDMNNVRSALSTDRDHIVGLPSGWSYSQLENTPHPSWNRVVQIAQELGMDESDPGAAYARVNPAMSQLDGARYFVTYGQTMLLRAEVAARGWLGSPADAVRYYSEGVRGSMEHLAFTSSDAEIPSSEIDAYIAANPLVPGTVDEMLEQINDQYWAGSFMMFIEAWANFRRSGYPDLQPPRVDHDSAPSSSDLAYGVWPRRLVYPGSEQLRNNANLQEALSNQGMNAIQEFWVPVWWDAD